MFDFDFWQYLFLIIAYFVAAVPFGLVFSKYFGNKDVRKHGSKNIGATNVTRVLGKKLGALTFLCDALKGALMIILARVIFDDNLDNYLALLVLVCVVGHVYPIYLRFRGGKGVATALACIMVMNWMLGVAFAVVWVIIYYSSKIVALASIFGSLAAVVLAVFFASYNQFVIVLLVSLLIIWRHRENIKNIIAGNEYKFEKK